MFRTIWLTSIAHNSMMKIINAHYDFSNRRLRHQVMYIQREVLLIQLMMQQLYSCLVEPMHMHLIKREGKYK